jgi:hypothetical protein
MTPNTLLLGVPRQVQDIDQATRACLGALATPPKNIIISDRAETTEIASVTKKELSHLSSMSSSSRRSVSRLL